MKPVRLFKRLGAALAVGLLALGLVAGTASAANAGGSSGEIGSASVSLPASSGEIG